MEGERGGKRGDPNLEIPKDQLDELYGKIFEISLFECFALDERLEKCLRKRYETHSYEEVDEFKKRDETSIKTFKTFRNPAVLRFSQASDGQDDSEDCETLAKQTYSCFGGVFCPILLRKWEECKAANPSPLFSFFCSLPAKDLNHCIDSKLEKLVSVNADPKIGKFLDQCHTEQFNLSKCFQQHGAMAEKHCATEVQRNEACKAKVVCPEEFGQVVACMKGAGRNDFNRICQPQIREMKKCVRSFHSNLLQEVGFHLTILKSDENQLVIRRE
eukprot:TRINITY_DN12663_c0_g1_i1.p1 TRINITY_DN12663_c0_g1~~TRINITY_DN12663_c0_g1_i1.p1  ORF type:complete len:285 (-),score=62.99 TRINITY_DN12663_c0_g1_i1:26-844(-)